jgi:integrase
VSVYRHNETKSKRYYFKFVIDGVTYKQTVKTARTRRQAEEAETRARDDVHAGRYVGPSRPHSITFERFAKEEYLPWAKAHRKDYAGRVLAVKLFCEHFGGVPLGRVAQITVERFKLAYSKSETKRGGHPAPATVNQRLQVLSAVMSHAVLLRYRHDNPCNGVEGLPIPEAEARHLSVEEEAELMPELLREGRWVVDVTRAAIGTGFRIRELLGLTKDAVDFARNLAFVFNPKGKKDPRKLKGVPMSSEVREMLLRLGRESPSRHFFVRPDTGERITRSMYYYRLGLACKRAGIVGIHPHSLRHTFGTRLGDADVNVKKIQRLMGHGDIQMTLRYLHPDDDSLRSAVELLAHNSTENVPDEALGVGAVSRKRLKAVG